jgi:hypothetical protein
MTFEELAEQKKVLDFYGMDNNFFKLDDQIYQAIENESDGYRSYLGEIKPISDEEADSNFIFFQNAVDRVTIVDVSNETFHGYEIVAIEDKHTWVRVGTDNVDDYYPMCIIWYHPRES